MTQLQHSNTSLRTATAVFASWLALAAWGVGCKSDAETADDSYNESLDYLLGGGGRTRGESNGDVDSNDPSGGSGGAGDDADGTDGELGGSASTPDAVSEGDGGSNASDPPATTRDFTACFTDGGPYGDCETIYVTIQESSPPRCTQLTIDNCEGYNRRTLTVDAPAAWDLANGSVGTDPNPCELGVFYPSSTLLEDATGSISWNETTRQPTDLVFQLSLEPSTSPSGDATNIDVSTSDPLELGACPEP